MSTDTMYWYIVRMYWRLSDKTLTATERWQWAYQQIMKKPVCLTLMNSLECALFGEGIEKPLV